MRIGSDELCWFAPISGAVLTRLRAAAVLLALAVTTVGLAAPTYASTFITIDSPNGNEVASDAAVTATGYNGSVDEQSIEIDCGTAAANQYPVPSGSFAVSVGSFSGPDSCDIRDASSRDLLASFTVAAPVTVPPDWWHTEGVDIYNSAEQRVALHGADDSQLDIARWKSTSPAPGATEMQNLARWGFNSIRVAITWANLEPSMPTTASGVLAHHWNKPYLAGLDNVITLARHNGLRIVLDMHQSGGWSEKFGGSGLPSWLYPKLAPCTSADASCLGVNKAHCQFLTDTAETGVRIRPQEGVIAAWRMLAKRYKSDPTVVGADIFNEPQACQLAGRSAPSYHVPTAADNPVDKFYLKAARNIQAVNPNLLLIYEDDAYEPFTTMGPALAGRLDLPNAVYSTHYYPDSWSNGNFPGSCKSVPSPTGQATMQAYQQRAVGFNQPLYIGEFDGFRLARNGKRCPLLQSVDAASTDLLDMMSYTKSQSISWSLWRYDPGGTMTDDAGNPKQPLISDLQTGF